MVNFKFTQSFFKYTSSLRDFACFGPSFTLVKSVWGKKWPEKLLATLILEYLWFYIRTAKGDSNEKAINELTREVLVNILCRLYVTAYSHDSKYYSHNSMGAIRTDLDRYFNKDDINISMTFWKRVKAHEWCSQCSPGRARWRRQNVVHTRPRNKGHQTISPPSIIYYFF